MLQFTNVFYKIHEAYKNKNVKYIISQGGSSSSKTFSTLQYLIALADKKPLHIDIVGLSVPHLKSGVLNDIQTIAPEFAVDLDKQFNKSDKELKLKGRINFLAFDKLGKAHGGRRDILYLNEANHLNYSIAEQLIIRTRGKVFIDYNPTNAFWVHKELMAKEFDKCRLIKSTYKDNQFLDESIIKAIESRRGDGNNNFWRVYGLGELGIADGLVFNNFKKDTFDKNKFANYYNGIDWGFSQDPFAFVRCAVENNKLYICDEIYQRNLLNKDSIPMVMDIIGRERVTCDSAEPKSVAEFVQMGINAVSSKKGAGSVESGIKFLQSFDEIIIHESCPNTYDEFCNYQWLQDKNGGALPKPIDAFNHCLIAGTMINTSNGLKPIEKVTEKDKVLTRNGYKNVLWSGVSDKNRVVYKLTTDKGNYIIGTGNHKVLTNKGFCDINTISYGDKVLIRRKECQNVLNCMVKNGEDTQNLRDVVIESISKMVVNTYITLFGKSSKVNVKKDMSFIIKIRIAKTIILRILKKLHQKNMSVKDINLVKKDSESKGYISKILDTKRLIGTLANMVSLGIKNTLGKMTLVNLIYQKLLVANAENYSNQKSIMKNFVLENVKAEIEEKMELITLLKCANVVEMNISQINTASKDFVVGHVQTVQELGIEEKVYDLTVEEQHEFIANGILVHNCIDSLRYSLEDKMNYAKTNIKINQRFL